jgi:hypothetical protein
MWWRGRLKKSSGKNALMNIGPQGELYAELEGWAARRPANQTNLLAFQMLKERSYNG